MVIKKNILELINEVSFIDLSCLDYSYDDNNEFIRSAFYTVSKTIGSVDLVAEFNFSINNDEIYPISLEVSDENGKIDLTDTEYNLFVETILKFMK